MPKPQRTWKSWCFNGSITCNRPDWSSELHCKMQFNYNYCPKQCALKCLQIKHCFPWWSLLQRIYLFTGFGPVLYSIKQQKSHTRSCYWDIVKIREKLQNAYFSEKMYLLVKNSTPNFVDVCLSVCMFFVSPINCKYM